MTGGDQAVGQHHGVVAAANGTAASGTNQDRAGIHDELAAVGNDETIRIGARPAADGQTAGIGDDPAIDRQGVTDRGTAANGAHIAKQVPGRI